MFKRLLRFATMLPLLAVALIPATAAAASGSTTIKGTGMTVVFPGTATLAGVTVVVPFTITCGPLPSPTYYSFGNASLSLLQASPARAANGQGYTYLSPGYNVTCDGVTANSMSMTINPNTYSSAFHPGPATANFSAQLCSYGYTYVCESASNSSVPIQIK
jgi:hypothetical protein